MLPQGTYPWIEKDVRVVGTQNLLISRLDLPVQLAYDIVKTLSSHRNDVGGGDHRLSDIGVGPETPTLFPVHPGALKFRGEAQNNCL
jgi:TRAP-type uncharacterized transport system substrate-binding protein